MLILSCNQVDYCQVVRLESDLSDTLPAVIYQGRFHVKGQTFPSKQKQEAIAQVQQALDRLGKLSILVEEQTGFSLYYFDEEVRLVAIVARSSLASSARDRNQLGFSDRAAKETATLEKKDKSQIILERLRQEWQSSFRLQRS